MVNYIPWSNEFALYFEAEHFAVYQFLGKVSRQADNRMMIVFLPLHEDRVLYHVK